ncbi:hypothetical protein CDAR_118091 [Caerostris darwini]|uniref:Uncharacterized protein n=1 Tax=Caerostris darwini TaxID=1538125 RepID=A0AAV4TDD6_9ARAC|nr:hypothetical protein CDAR_118091 [Caerostris darwini]
MRGGQTRDSMAMNTTEPADVLKCSAVNEKKRGGSKFRGDTYTHQQFIECASMGIKGFLLIRWTARIDTPKHWIRDEISFLRLRKVRIHGKGVDFFGTIVRKQCPISEIGSSIEKENCLEYLSNCVIQFIRFKFVTRLGGGLLCRK